jgi:broad specificity phosphatase PhoE
VRLVLVRHGETEWNRQRRVQGLSNLALNKTGMKQAEALARALSREKVNAIYSSPLRRAEETARAIGRFHGVRVEIMDGLKELDVGAVDGMTYEDMKLHHGEFFARWMTDFTSVRLPGGGFIPELRDQCCTAIRDIVSRERKGDNDDSSVVVVTHFFPILCIICDCMGLDLSYCRRLKVDLASVSVIEFKADRTVLVSLNDTCHLREGPS